MPKLFKKRLFNQRGITLIELIAVILIIGIIAAVGIPVVFNQISNAEEEADRANMAIVNDAIERYALMNSGYIATGLVTGSTPEAKLNTLIELLKNPAVEGGPYLSAGVEIEFNTYTPAIRESGTAPNVVVTGIYKP